MKNKSVIISAILLGGLLLSGTLLAKTARADEENQYPPFMEKLAERFGLKQDEVQNFLDEERAGRHAEMQKSFEERLNQAVSDGKISEEQKKAILAKRAELQKNMAQTREEAKVRREEHRAEMQKWAGENGIDWENLGGLLGPGMGGGHRDGMGMGMGMGKNR